MAHYTMVVDVFHVERENQPGERGIDKGKVEVGKIVLRSATADGLRRKAQMAIDTILSDEDEGLDDM